MIVPVAEVSEVAVVVARVVVLLDMVILPLAAIDIQVVPEEDAVVKRLSGSPAVPWIASDEPGVDEPIPKLPFDPKLNISAPVDDAIAKVYGEVEVPSTVRVAIGVVVPPIPTLPF